MKKSTEYENKEIKAPVVNEPEAVYHSLANEATEEYAFMPKAEAEQKGLSLDESRRLLFERIHADFHS